MRRFSLPHPSRARSSSILRSCLRNRREEAGSETFSLYDCELRHGGLGMIER
ncbi:hypothetical protein Mp_3g20940 [Marchantia polymorpha subsp. ruderalis]|uniref:Uncharacterized protein n=2 Tax=Marchantia polymorpha TaxID=3197 RepID=A0AAF6B330_MARPO|nr:hypothetical protein MARPO_0159s0024 [Marchantia polymorpha]BBN06414.1 hypothetical protein Mp_3g20940 [Marchantia polymorpha subsp. ruderalis]|eukprot:PTQ28610.1 hypothetical protein MARPO_0159s0024 [Marchantia polymorpha]